MGLVLLTQMSQRRRCRLRVMKTTTPTARGRNQPAEAQHQKKIVSKLDDPEAKISLHLIQCSMVVPAVRSHLRGGCLMI